MMENCLDTIAVLSDASKAKYRPVERASHYRKLHFHTSMQEEALFRFKPYDQLFFCPKSSTGLHFWNRSSTKPLLVNTFLSALARLTTHMPDYFESYRYQELLIRQENSLSKSCLKPNLQIFPFDILIIGKQ